MRLFYLHQLVSDLLIVKTVSRDRVTHKWTRAYTVVVQKWCSSIAMSPNNSISWRVP